MHIAGLGGESGRWLLTDRWSELYHPEETELAENIFRVLIVLQPLDKTLGMQTRTLYVGAALCHLVLYSGMKGLFPSCYIFL